MSSRSIVTECRKLDDQKEQKHCCWNSIYEHVVLQVPRKHHCTLRIRQWDHDLTCSPICLEANKLHSIPNYRENCITPLISLKRRGTASSQVQTPPKNNCFRIGLCLSCAFRRPSLQGKPKTFTYPKQ